MAATKIDFADTAKTEKGIAAIDMLTDYLAKEGEGLVPAIKAAIAVYPQSDAKMVYTEAWAASCRKANKAVTEPASSRVSACAGLWKGTDWKAWDAFLDNVNQIKPAWDTLITLSNWFRGKDENKKFRFAKDFTVAPTVAEIEAFLNIKKEKRASKAKEEPLTGLDAVKAAPSAALDSVMATLIHLATIEPAGEAKGFLVAAQKALETYKPFVVERDEAAEIEAVKAKWAKEKELRKAQADK